MELSPKFPLLKLPFLCIQEVFLNSDILDLINISFASKRSHWLVKKIRTPLKCLDVEVKKTHVDIVFRFDKCIFDGGWCISFDESNKDLRLTQFEGHPDRKSLDEPEMGIDISDRVQYYHFFSDEPMQSLKNGIAYFLDLFRIPLGAYYFTSLALEISKRPESINVSKFQWLVIEMDTPMENDHLKNLIEKVTFTEVLLVLMKVNPDFYCDPIPLKTDKISFSKGSCGWVTREFLFALEVNHIRLTFLDPAKVNANDFENFVDRWYQSNNTTFKMLAMNWTDTPDDIDLARFNAIEWEEEPERRSQFYLVNRGAKLDLSQGHDILRKDGLLATVYKLGNTWVFCVWHDRFPNTEGLWECSERWQ